MLGGAAVASDLGWWLSESGHCVPVLQGHLHNIASSFHKRYRRSMAAAAPGCNVEHELNSQANQDKGGGLDGESDSTHSSKVEPQLPSASLPLQHVSNGVGPTPVNMISEAESGSIVEVEPGPKGAGI